MSLPDIRDLNECQNHVSPHSQCLPVDITEHVAWPVTLGADLNYSPNIETSHVPGSGTGLDGEIPDHLLVCQVTEKEEIGVYTSLGQFHTLFTKAEANEEPMGD